MESKQPYALKNYRTAAFITVVVGVILIVISFLMTKRDFFLLLNADMGYFGDTLFRNWTHLGDGTIWILVGILFLAFRRDKFLLALSSVVIGTIIVQSLKNFIIPAQVRPGTAIQDLTLFHSVDGVELLTNYSFPSGHTTTAFSVFLLATLFFNKNWIVPLGFIIALMVGYSRVYLAEHFPLDVGGGMLTAVLSVALSLYIQRKWEERNNAPNKS